MANDVLEGMDEMFADSAATTPQPEPQITPEPVQPEPVPAPTPEKTGQPRAADGTFAPNEPVQPAAPAQSSDPGKQPISQAEFKGYLEERDKRQKAEARAAAAEAQLQAARDSQTPSDPDPEVAKRIQGARLDAIFSTSEKWAKKEHGEDLVTSAMAWAMERSQQNPAFAAEYLRQEHPVEWAVKQQKRDTILNQIGDDPDAFIRAKIAEMNAASAASPQTQAQPSQAASPQLAAPSPPQVQQPPRSIATATAAGGGVNVVPPAGEFAMADELFNR